MFTLKLQYVKWTSLNKNVRLRLSKLLTNLTNSHVLHCMTATFRVQAALSVVRGKLLERSNILRYFKAPLKRVM